MQLEEGIYDPESSISKYTSVQLFARKLKSFDKENLN